MDIDRRAMPQKKQGWKRQPRKADKARLSRGRLPMAAHAKGCPAGRNYDESQPDCSREHAQHRDGVIAAGNGGQAVTDRDGGH